MEQRMERDVLQKLKRQKHRRFWSKLVSVMMCIVVFCTTYALILPAITLETDTFCGKEAHTHTVDCYPTHGDLICTIEAHIHTDACNSVTETALVCELQEVQGHSHTESCNITQEKTLLCQIPESPGHAHSEECQKTEEKNLICQAPESAGHTHTTECSITEQLLTCLLEETEGHSHGEGCFADTLTCTLSEDETHTHETACYTQQLICTLAEAPSHTHGESCYSEVTTNICGQEVCEAHTHTDDCYSITVHYGCGLKEAEAHAHTDACYTTTTSYGCGLEEAEPHAHDDACYEPAHTCPLTETEGHAHSDACYRTVYDCGLEEQEHVHAEECYAPSPALICTLEENDAHTHTAECYTGSPTCELEEHEHTLACYSDPEADVESAATWEAALAHVALTGDWATDVVAIAQTQIGYTESTRNYEVWGDNSIHGYTRYGAWYGSPYGDWCAMFASFCLRYAGVDSIPINCGVRPWIDDLASRGLYYSADEMLPQMGSLIFFDWEGDGLADHVGIVAEVHEAQEHTGASITAIEGNSSNCVKYVYYKPTDSVILGYGLLPGQERIPVTVEDPEEGEYQINTDINLGPVVILTAEEMASEEGAMEEMASEEGAEAGRMMFAIAPRSTTDLKEYLGRQEVSGSFFLTLTDNNNKELPKDENGNFIAEPGIPYQLTLTVDSPKGFAPGSYTYQLPAGLTVQAGSGQLVVDGIQLGTWSIDENGLITLVFNNEANQYTNVKLSAQMGIQFQASDAIIEFDGKIKVAIKKPPEDDELKIKMEKWGGSQDGTSLTWQVRVVGHEGANIAGTVVTDRITSGNHSYTDQNRANNIHITATGKSDTGEVIWHQWFVSVGDPNLNYWNDTGWQYKMPATVYCENCKQTITLADDWTYDFYYTSTPEASDVNGTVYYSNRAEFGDYDKEGLAQIKYGTGPVTVEKSGYFQGDEEGGKFVWQVRVSIPGMSEGQKAVSGWYMTDGLSVKDAAGEDVARPRNDIDLARVTLVRNGTTTTLNRVQNATASDDIAWDCYWNSYDQIVSFYCRCNCTADICKHWENGKCSEEHITGFCQCWTITEDVGFIFDYATNAPEIIQQYSDAGLRLANTVQMWHNDGWQAYGYADIKIPSLFEKTLTDDFDTNDPNHPEKKYIASYTITLNEAKQNLSPDGSPITIIDEMTDSLIYVAGSMVITAEDVYGNTQVLNYGTDYTLTYDGSDRADNLHVLTIVLNNPQPAMYTLKYDTTINIKGDITSAIPYQNWAKVTIRGKNLTADTDKLIYADINYAAKTYRVDILKTAESTNVPLPNATFGLYNEAGGLIVSQETDANGKLTFVTSITDGIILLEHVPYYIQEIQAPEGFVLDTTKYWFYFCDQGEGCTEGSGIQEQHKNAVRIPGDQVYMFNLKNTSVGYELPETGGAGTQLYTTAGLLLMLTSAAYLMYINRPRRREEF